MTKHERKLKKKAAKLKRYISSHELFKNWGEISVKVCSNKIHLKVVKINGFRNAPECKKITLGIKENINIERFLGKFREP